MNVTSILLNSVRHDVLRNRDFLSTDKNNKIFWTVNLNFFTFKAKIHSKKTVDNIDHNLLIQTRVNNGGTKVFLSEKK